MSYRPRTIGSTVNPTGRKVDGSATFTAAFSTSGNVSPSTTRSGVVASADLTSAIDCWGGAIRSNSTFLPILQRGLLLTANWGFNSTIDKSGGLYKIRMSVEANFTGAGNVLSDTLVVWEWIP